MRRIPLGLRGRDQGLDVADRVAARMAELLGWSDAEKAKQLSDFQHVIATTRRYRR
jgi:glycerol-3-phosphate dehydrogenase